MAVVFGNTLGGQGTGLSKMEKWWLSQGFLKIYKEFRPTKLEEKFQKLVKEGKNRKHDNGIDRTLQLCNFDEHQIDLGCQTFHKH